MRKQKRRVVRQDPRQRYGPLDHLSKRTHLAQPHLRASLPLNSLYFLCLITSPLLSCIDPGLQRPITASPSLLVLVVYEFLVSFPALLKPLAPSLQFSPNSNSIEVEQITLQYLDVSALWPSDLPIQPVFLRTTYWTLYHPFCVPTLWPQLPLPPNTITQKVQLVPVPWQHHNHQSVDSASSCIPSLSLIQISGPEFRHLYKHP